MKTSIAIDGTRFLINGEPTYKGREYSGKTVEGLLHNSRMVQAIFDDECKETRKHWCYPDSGVWDPDRNTDEFCAALGEYRKHGLLGVTVGLQGGGSIYTGEIYNNYLNSAYTPNGELKAPYFNRLLRIIKAADEVGMIVIVNYFYVKQAYRFESERVIRDATEATTDWLLRTGYENLLIDIANESHDGFKHEILRPAHVHRLIDIAKSTTLDGRRLLTGVSTCGGQNYPASKWMEAEDFTLPHGNGLQPEAVVEKTRVIRKMPAYIERPRPILFNEDSVFPENLCAAVSEYASWGFYNQGYGSDYKDLMDWKAKDRETRYEDLSGYQTVPVNWGINTELKKCFFDAVAEVTGSE